MKKGKSKPTVVFESGLDPGGHLPWFKVQDACSEFATTISYDRSGVLWSERGHSPKTASAISEELSLLLAKTECAKPYIIVAHSLAGLFTRNFIVQNKESVQGVIFVDVSHPEQDERKTKEFREISKPISPWIIRSASALGILRLFYNKAYPGTEKEDAINQTVHALFYNGVSTFLEEQDSMKTFLAESRTYQDFDSIPLRIITGYSPNRYSEIKNEKLRAEFFNYKMELQHDLLNLSSQSSQICANESGHYVQLEQPEIIVDQIRELIKLKN
ncbi:MAG: alpha/beta hydrolase [Deferribacteres bacterium]|nr:alpha/beta hydrolase [candidate division KSB1 bacterium]MCB9502257.1 alpha/beta hydrolase [Deferribacteres bacterium]